jgi:hypothetical protein
MGILDRPGYVRPIGGIPSTDLDSTTQSTIQGSATALTSISNTYAAASGETGVINPWYQVGDVRRYGVFPDGKDLTGLGFTASSTTVTAPVGTFSANMVGMILCSPNITGGSASVVPPTISSVASDGASCVLAFAAAVTQAGAKARCGTYWERDKTSYVSAIYANAVLPGITIRWPAGYYVTALNFKGSASSNTKMTFDTGVEFSGLFHLITDAGFPGSGSPLTNLKLAGNIVIYDRLGIIGLQDSDLSQLNVTLKSDPTKNFQGLPSRGCHWYNQVKNDKFGEIVVEDTGVGTALNCDGGFIVDSSDCANLKIRRLHIKDTAGHGLYMLGEGHEIGELRIDAWGASATNHFMQEAQSLAQSQELCAVWLKRCMGLKIGSLRINQAAPTTATGTLNATTTVTGTGGAFLGQRVGQTVAGTGIAASTTVSAISNDGNTLTLSQAATGSGSQALNFTRTNALYVFRGEDTRNATVTPSSYSLPRIDTMFVANAARRGISIGDRNNPYNRAEFEIGNLDISAATWAAAGSAIDTGYSLVHINANATPASYGRNKLLGVAVLRAHDTKGSDLLQVPVNTDIDIHLIDTSGTGGHAGRIVTFNGAGEIRRIRHDQAVGDTGPTLITFAPDRYSRIGPVDCDAYFNIALSHITPVDLTSAANFEIGPISLKYYRNTDQIKVSGASNGTVKLGTCVGYSSQGGCLNFLNNTKVQLVGGSITGYATGTYGSGNTTCTAQSVLVSGNTTNTSLANGQVSVDAGCTAVTL